MKHRVRSWALLVVGLAAATAAALAQDRVYRCGADGREYSKSPCPGGKVVDVADPRSQSQRREAEVAAQRQTRLGDQLARERRARDAAAAGQKAAGITGRAGKSSETEKSHAKKRKPKASKKRIQVDDPNLSPPFKPADGAPTK
jgi:hypothetical protein